jgi:hypothetical protein
MILDILLLVVIVVLIGLSAAEGLVRSLVMLFGFYLLCILIGMVIVGFDIAQVLSDAVLSSMEATSFTPTFYQGAVFIGFLVPAFAILIVVSHSGLEGASLAVLKWGDNVLGTVVGVLLALAFAAVLCNAWGVIVSDRWAPDDVWRQMRQVWDQSVLRPYMLSVLRIYRRTLFPFGVSGYPVFFIPQA